MTEPEKKKPIQLDLAKAPASKPTASKSVSIVLWTLFVLLLIPTALTALVLMSSNYRFLIIVGGGAAVLTTIGVLLVRFFNWHTALAGIMVCATMILLLAGTCSDGFRIH